MKTLCWGYGIGLVFGQSGIQGYFIKRTTKRGKDRGFRISGICLQNLLGSGIKKKIFPGSEKMKIFSGLQGTRTVPVFFWGGGQRGHGPGPRAFPYFRGPRTF